MDIHSTFIEIIIFLLWRRQTAMKYEKHFGVALVVLLTCIIIGLLVQNILELRSDFSKRASFVTFEVIQDGIYDSSVVTVASFTYDDSAPLNTTMCTCTRHFQIRNQTFDHVTEEVLGYNESCELLETELQASIIRKKFNDRHLMHVFFLRGPQLFQSR